MPRGERSTPPPEAVEEAMETLGGRLPKQKSPEVQTFGSPFEALVDKIARRQTETDPDKQQELDGDIAADVSFLTEKMNEAGEDTVDLHINDLKQKIKGARGKSRSALQGQVHAMEEALERIRGQRLEEIPEPPTNEQEPAVRDGASAEQQETDRIIAQEQRTILDDVDRRLLGAISNPEHKVAETRMLSGLRKKIKALRSDFETGKLSAKDFTTDSALLFADIQEKTGALQQDIADREESREEIAGIFREVKRSQDVVGPEGMAAPSSVEEPSEADQEVRDRIQEYRNAPPPENLPVADEADVELIDDAEPVAVPLTTRKEKPIPLELRKVTDAEEIAPDTSTAQIDPSYRTEAQAQASIQEKADYYLTLDPEARQEMRAELQSQLDAGAGSRAYEGWSRADLYQLNRQVEQTQKTADRLQQGERERTDLPESADKIRGRLKKQVEQMMRETPNAAELMRVHTGSGWETLDAESFANRYLNLLNKDIAYTQAKKQTSFFGKVGNLFGRKGPEAAIMTGAERSEFKQMDAIMEELGIEKSTYSTATPSIR